MDAVSFLETGLVRGERLLAWVLAEVLTTANLVQVPAVALTGLAAWIVSRPLRRWLCTLVARKAESPGHDYLHRHRDWIVDRLIPLLTPAFWLAGLWIAVVLGSQFGWPHDVARIAVNLLAAWLGIRLVADLVPSRALARLIAVVAWSLAALNIVHLLQPLSEMLDSVALTLSTVRISALTVIKGLLLLTLLLWTATFTSRLFEQQVAVVAGLTPRAQVLLGKLLKITLVTLAFVVALTSVGIDLSAFALLTGAVGVGVGLGLQKTVSNLFSGILLLLDRSIKPGDVIEVGGTYGWVSALGARYVAVETRDGMEYLIPNEHIITQQVLNWSHKSDRVRLKVDVRAPLDADLELVLKLMREAADRPLRVLKQPAPNALIMGFSENAVELQLRIWIRDAPNGVQNVKGEVLLEIWRLFREHGIALPRPKRDVFIRALPEPDGTEPDPAEPRESTALGRRLA